MKLEQRKLASPPEVRAGEGGAPNKLVGYALKFGVESCILCDPNVNGGRPFVEVLDPKVLDRTLRESPDVRALYNHDTSAVLGRTLSGTLTLEVDDVGLSYVDELPATIDGERARVLVGRGDIDGCSFGFIVVEDSIEDRGDEPALRTLLDIDLHEISIAVTFPAYESTIVQLRTSRTVRATTATPRLARARRALMLEFESD
jgi:HK97 family phage prohead protease